jgi:serine protease
MTLAMALGYTAAPGASAAPAPAPGTGGTHTATVNLSQARSQVAARQRGSHRVTTRHFLRPRGFHGAASGVTPQAVIPGPLINNGGPVQDAPQVFVVFWGFNGNDPSGEEAYMTSFLQTVGGTSWLATVNQYGGGSNITFGGAVDDSSTPPASPADADVQNEAQAAAQFFNAGTSQNVQIVVATPTGQSTPGFGTQFCAYHGAVAADPNITYTNMPYVTDAGQACGENSVNANGTDDGVSIVEGHELAEAITDPLLNAWFDAQGNEIGDKCAFVNLSNINTGGGQFAVQPLWSNQANDCVLGS